MQDFISQMALKYPFIVAILGGVGFVRLINKPLFSFLHALADATPTQKDNVILDEVEQSKIYKGFLYVLDWTLSIKLPGQAEAPKA